MFKKPFLLVGMLAGSFVLTNCSSDSAPANLSLSPADICDMELPTVTSNSPVTSGDSIQLETPHYSTMAEYFWTGPNGFTSNEQNPDLVASAQSAGTYTLVIAEGGCNTDPVSVTIAVNDAIAPCNPANNTASNSVYPTQLFNSVLQNVSQDQYEIHAGGSQGDLTIAFASDATPAAGVYAVCPDCPTSFMEPNEVCVSIVTGGTFSDYFRANQGSVYVTFVNGHISATFCSLAFNGTGVGVNFVSSAKVTTSN